MSKIDEKAAIQACNALIGALKDNGLKRIGYGGLTYVVIEAYESAKSQHPVTLDPKGLRAGVIAVHDALLNGMKVQVIYGDALEEAFIEAYEAATTARHITGSSNGRTADFESVNLGSSPSPVATEQPVGCSMGGKHQWVPGSNGIPPQCDKCKEPMFETGHHKSSIPEKQCSICKGTGEGQGKGHLCWKCQGNGVVKGYELTASNFVLGMKEKLLPCPFCGSSSIDPEGVASFKPEYRTPENNWRNATPEKIQHFPACNNCSATTNGDWNTRPKRESSELTSEIKPANEWQPISTAPKDGTPIQLWLADEGFPVKAAWRKPPLNETESECWYSFELDCDLEIFHDPTHWMPLPQPPENAGRGSDDE